MKLIAGGFVICYIRLWKCAMLQVYYFANWCYCNIITEWILQVSEFKPAPIAKELTWNANMKNLDEKARYLDFTIIQQIACFFFMPGKYLITIKMN